MPLFLDTCQLLPCWKIQVLILGIWRNTNISQNLSKFWVLLLISGDPVECSASCAHLHFHEVVNWQRSGGGVFCLPLMSICNPPIYEIWMIFDTYMLQYQYSYCLYIIVRSQVCTPIYSCCKHLYEPVFLGSQHFFKNILAWCCYLIARLAYTNNMANQQTNVMFHFMSNRPLFVPSSGSAHGVGWFDVSKWPRSCDHFEVRKWLNIIISSKLLQGSAWGIRQMQHNA